jgi:outer membrane protein with beta-barrel domain
MKRWIPVMLLVLGMATGASLAGPIYVGGSWGKTDVEVKSSGINFNQNDSSYKLFVGYRFLKFFGVEGGYVNMGSPSDNSEGTDTTIKTTGYNAFAVGVLPAGKHFEIFGKLGIIHWDKNIDQSGTISGSSSDTGNDRASGIGVGFLFSGHLALRGEYEKFSIADTDKVAMTSFGIDLRF